MKKEMAVTTFLRPMTQPKRMENSATITVKKPMKANNATIAAQSLHMRACGTQTKSSLEAEGREMKKCFDNGHIVDVAFLVDMREQ